MSNKVRLTRQFPVVLQILSLVSKQLLLVFVDPTPIYEGTRDFLRIVQRSKKEKQKLLKKGIPLKIELLLKMNYS